MARMTSKYSRAIDLFIITAAAECSVTQASAELEIEDAHDSHDDHGYEVQAHADHGHEEHAEDHREDEAGHTEFHAEYLLTCADPGAISGITFAYFDIFENPRELAVQIVTASGAQAFEVECDDAPFDLRGMF